MFVTEKLYENLDRLISKKDEFRPCPTIDDRDKWNGIPEDIRKIIGATAKKYKDMRYPATLATDLMSYQRTGSRQQGSKGSSLKREALAHLLMAECIENTGEHMDDIINAVWSLCEESSWVSVYHYHLYRTPQVTMFPDPEREAIDLGCSEIGVLLAFTYYLLKDKLNEVSPMIVKRLKLEIKKRIINPFLYNRSWWWMGYSGKKVNNWAPWCSSNCLMTILLLEENEELRKEAVYKTLEIADKFIGIYSEDGGCDEGPAYWNRAAGSLFDCLMIVKEASKGSIDFFNETIIRNVGEFPAKVHIADKAFTNFADSNPFLETHYDLLYRYGKETNSNTLIVLAQDMFGILGVTDPAELGVLRGFPYMFTVEEFRNREKIMEDIPLTNVFEGIQVLATRQCPKKNEGYCVAIKGGHNNESHNHNDLGNFVVYQDGSPCIMDVGSGTYVKDTFGPRRYRIWNMQGQYHNVPVIGGVQQMFGEQYEATNFQVLDTPLRTKANLDLSKAYPTEAGINKLVRSVELDRQGSSHITLEDEIKLGSPQCIEFHFMLCNMPIERKDGIELIAKNGSKTFMTYDTENFNVKIKTIELVDETLKKNWGNELYCLYLISEKQLEKGVFEIKLSPLC